MSKAFTKKGGEYYNAAAGGPNNVKVAYYGHAN